MDACRRGRGNLGCAHHGAVLDAAVRLDHLLFCYAVAGVADPGSNQQKRPNDLKTKRSLELFFRTVNRSIVNRESGNRCNDVTNLESRPLYVDIRESAN